MLEDLNINGATTICTAAATFGLIFGSLIGGPLGKRLIEKHSLLNTAANEDDSLLVEDEKKHERHTNMYADSVFQLILAIGVGTIFTMLLTKTGLTFPIYIGAMLAAALMRNICEYTGIATIHMGEINDLGGISLSLFLGMAMITLRLWELASLALPLVILLAAQVLLIIIFTYVIEFNIMGRRLRCSHTCIRHLRLRNRSHTKRHGKYAGCLRPICAVHQGISAHTARRKPVCRLFKQPCNHILYKPTVKQPEKNMFEKLKKIFKNREEKEKHNYDLTFDNVAIPEVHVKSTESHEDADKENAPISYDNVAIPEVHIRNRKNK